MQRSIPGKRKSLFEDAEDATRVLRASFLSEFFIEQPRFSELSVESLWSWKKDHIYAKTDVVEHF